MKPASDLLDDFRREFAACERYAYFMAAAVSPMSHSARAAIIAHTAEMAQEGGLRFEHGLQLWEDCRAEFAALIGAEPRQIAMLGSASLAYNILASELRGRFNDVRVQRDEFPSAVLPWHPWGYDVRSVMAEQWADEAEQDWGGLVALPLVHFANGRRTPEDVIRSLCAHADRYVILNATQAIGCLPFSVRDTPVDALVCTSHKWMLGHEGVCFLYMSDRLAESLARRFIGWRSALNPMVMSSELANVHKVPRQYEMGLASSVSAAGTLAGMRLLSATGVDRIWCHVRELRHYLMGALAEQGFVTDSPAVAEEGSGIVLLRCKEPMVLKERLAGYGVLATARGGGLRLALHGYNNCADIDRLLEGLTACRSLLMA